MFSTFMVTKDYKHGTLAWSAHTDPKFETKKIYQYLDHPKAPMGEPSMLHEIQKEEVNGG